LERGKDAKANPGRFGYTLGPLITNLLHILDPKKPDSKELAELFGFVRIFYAYLVVQFKSIRATSFLSIALSPARR
jgi:hypothetical protein